MADIVQYRRGSAALWTTTNPTLADGEVGLETDTRFKKTGNGIDPWNALPYDNTGAGGGGNEITNAGKKTALQLNTNWGASGNYEPVMTSNTSTVLTGQAEHDYFIGTDSVTGSVYKYEIKKVSTTLSVIRIALKYL